MNPPGHAATEVIDENLSENDGEDLKKMKENELILENKYKDMDNRLREEKGGDILLLANEGEEKHLAEQGVKEKEEKENEVKGEDKDKAPEILEDLAKLDTQLKGILKTSDSKSNVKDEGGGPVISAINVKVSTAEVIKPEPRVVYADKSLKPDGANVKVSRTLPQLEKFENAISKVGVSSGSMVLGSVKDKAGLPPPAPSRGSGQLLGEKEEIVPPTHSVKQLVRNFERSTSRENLEIPKAFSVPENMNEKEGSGQASRRQSEPSCNIVENSFPEHLISRAQLTFAIMQADERTQTLGDDNVDENATRAAPFTQASQWQGVSGFASSSESENDEEGGEEVIGADGKVHKSTTKSKHKVNLLNTLADEDDLKLDSVVRNIDGDRDSSKALRNSLIFIEDDIEASPHEQWILVKDRIDEKSINVESKELSFSLPDGPDRSKSSKADWLSDGANNIMPSNSSLPHASTVPSRLSDKLSDKFTKDFGNRMNIPSKYPSSPSKSSLKDKESLSDVKRLAVLNNLKLSAFGKQLSGSNLRKERSSDSLDKLLKEKTKDSINSPNSSPSKSRHLLRPIDLVLKEKTKSDGDIAGSERRSRSKSREDRDRGRSSSRSDDKKIRRQSLSTIEEQIKAVSSPTVSPLQEKSIINDDAVPPGTKPSALNNIETNVKNAAEDLIEKKEKKQKKRSSSASRAEKREMEKQKNVEQSNNTPVPPLELNAPSRVPKPPAPGSAPKKNLVYSAR